MGLHWNCREEQNQINWGVSLVQAGPTNLKTLFRIYEEGDKRTMLNDLESRYPVFTPANSKEKLLSCYNVGGNRKLNSRRLKCSLESLSIPLSSTHTHPRSSNLTVTVYSSITVNCSLGNLAGLHILPHLSPL